MKTIILVFLFSFSTISSVHALTGEKWLKICESPEVTDNVNCLFYLGGMSDMYLFMQDSSIESYIYVEGKKYLIKKSCFPNGVSIGQQKKIMMKHFNNNPEELHERFEYIYPLVMRDTFPCK